MSFRREMRSGSSTMCSGREMTIVSLCSSMSCCGLPVDSLTSDVARCVLASRHSPRYTPSAPPQQTSTRPSGETRGRVQLRPETTPTEDTFHVMPDEPQPSTPGPASATASRPALGRLWLAGYAILCGALLLVFRYSFLDHPTELVDLWKISDGD